MTLRRIVQSILTGAAVGLVGASCSPETPADPGTGGSPATGGAATGGRVTGGKATGGSRTGGAAAGGIGTAGASSGGSVTGGAAPALLCDAVQSLPTLGTACDKVGESRCDPSGNQCVCQGGSWYCSTSCASTYPTVPTPNSACTRGAACNYPAGASCSCINSRWTCIGTSACPAGMPTTGDTCPGLTGSWCEYPSSDSTPSVACYCDTNSTWTCIVTGTCPTAQPFYDPTGTCAGVAFCSYDSTRCNCLQQGTPWVCGVGVYPPLG